MALLYWLAQAEFLQKMLSNSRVMGDNMRGAVCLGGTEEIRAVLRRIMVLDWSENVLLNAFLQRLGCTYYVSTVAVAHKLISDIVVVMGR